MIKYQNLYRKHVLEIVQSKAFFSEIQFFYPSLSGKHAQNYFNDYF